MTSDVNLYNQIIINYNHKSYLLTTYNNALPCLWPDLAFSEESGRVENEILNLTSWQRERHISTLKVGITYMYLLNKNNNKNYTFGDKALLFPNARLPILQGGTFTLLSPTMALLSMPEWTCPAWTQNASLVNTSSPEFINVWQSRMQVVSISVTDSLCKDSWTYYVEWF